MKYLSLFLILFISQISSAQIFDPVDWDYEVEEVATNEYKIHLTAKLDYGWKMYSQYIDQSADITPTKTEVTFDTLEGTIELIGKTEEPEADAVFDEIFQIEVKSFKNEVIFTQHIKILDPEKVKQKIKASIYYSVCDDERCLQPTTEEFFISLNGSEQEAKDQTLNQTLDERSKEMSEELKLNIIGADDFEDVNKADKKSYLSIFLLGLLGGFIALLTPCVFPMIPLTVSFFTKKASSKFGVGRSILYGFFIFLIYVLLSLPFHLLDSVNPEILNNISTNVVLNIIFFVIFVVFAFSFFGYFELTLPSSWSNALDSRANSISGVLGIFFMALTLAVVSFSCTGPILGSLLGSSLSSDVGAMQLTMGMSGFGLALALPFTLFAMFPKWLNKMPKSGSWLNTVKVVLGFIELGLAIKFLSNADLVEHWGLLKREVFIGLWIVIAIGLALYLLGKIKFPHDSPNPKIGVTRITLAAITVAFVVYLIPGLTNTSAANLKLLSGFPPPLFYSLYEKTSECPLGLECYKDFETGLAVAKAQNKPIMLDFTGWACVNCRKMEEQVWSDPEVYDIIANNYILISLYVDDRKELPKDNQFKYSKTDGSLKSIKTIGDKWATFQTINFQNNSQPYYVLMSPNLEMLNKPIAYTPNVNEYLNWLEIGLQNFKNRNAGSQFNL